MDLALAQYGLAFNIIDRIRSTFVLLGDNRPLISASSYNYFRISAVMLIVLLIIAYQSWRYKKARRADLNLRLALKYT